MLLSLFSRVRLFATLWTVVCQAPLPMWFSRQEYRRGLPWPPPEDLPDPGIEPTLNMSPALAGRFFPTRANWEAQFTWEAPLKRGLVHPAPPSTRLPDSYTSSEPGAQLFINYSAGETVATSNSYLKNKDRNRRGQTKWIILNMQTAGGEIILLCRGLHSVPSSSILTQDLSLLNHRY